MIGTFPPSMYGRAEDLAYMADHGETLTRAARRLNMSAPSLRRWMENNHHNGILAKLIAAETLPDGSRKATP